MKRPAVFITYFQSPSQIMHVHKLSRSAYFFQKFYGGFNLMSMFFTFHHLRENLWKDLLILWLIFELFMVICRLTKFFGLKLPNKKMAPLSKCHQFLINFGNFEQRLRKKLWKDLRFFFNIFKLPLFLYVFTKFHDQQITKKSMPFVSICQQKLVYCPNFEQYSWQKLWKTLQFV